MNRKVYFVLYDIVDERSENGWRISNPHEVKDVCSRGFFTGNEKDFPVYADFTPWEKIGRECFFHREDAKKMVQKLGNELKLNEEDGYKWMNGEN